MNIKLWIMPLIGALTLTSLTGCSITQTLLKEDDVVAMMADVYGIDVTVNNCEKSRDENHHRVYTYDLTTRDGQRVTFTAFKRQNPDGSWSSVGQSDYLTGLLENTYWIRWYTLCGISPIDYERDGAFFTLCLEYTDDLDVLVYEVAKAAQLCSAMFNDIALVENPTTGYLPTDYVTVTYQTSADSDDAIVLGAFNFAQSGLYTPDYLAAQMQLKLRQAGYLTTEMEEIAEMHHASISTGVATPVATAASEAD